ncbi:hypothetical protein [Micromonospora sp. NPDC047730]|uniref:hypothetical protein n=1 Tax=Micromonospora sp. NPDC047730 TaxID=3364253 RepID=UPI00371B8782
MAEPVVGVLLPVRIETRFSPGLLRLLVVPDEPWFARHDPRVSPGEVDAVRRYLDAGGGEVAWRELTVHVGGARAVWLVRTLVVTAPDGTTALRPVGAGELRTEPAFPRIEEFPDTLHVWLARGGGPPAQVLTLAVDRGRLAVDFPDPDAPADRRWWENWDEAVEAGLAGKVPLDGDPSDIDALYVTGLGDGDPGALFGSHRDEGRLSLLAPGSATNTVDGAPAAPVTGDPAAWWGVLTGTPTDTDRLVSATLTGDPGLLGALPGTSEPHRRWAGAAVAGLWPALWGFAGADVWALPTGAAAEWAPGALLPEGPFPTLRVGPQPYGLLPATVLRRWVPEPKDPPVEAGLVEPLSHLRAEYAAAAEQRGTVVGASTEELLDLIAQVPTSPLFRHRRAWPLELWWLVLLLLGYGASWSDLDAAWRHRHPDAERLGLAPHRRYGATGAPRRLEIPLVTPDGLPAGTGVADVLKRLLEVAEEQPWAYANRAILEKELLREYPLDSLLLRLAVRSLQVAIGDVGRALAGEAPPGPEPVARDAATGGRLQGWIANTPAAALHGPTPQARAYERVVDGLLALGEIEPPRLERLLRATVDTAAYRVDPWLLGPPTRRLHDLVEQQAAKPRLGAYGWVDRPRPGAPGPTAAGLIHAPSAGQGLAATVLRDRAVSDPSPRWDLDLTSRSVRDADRIAEHVRVGAHLAEALGREVERVVGTPAGVERLRRDFPVRTEHAGRRVCDGLAVLAAPPGDLGLDPDRLAGLDRLRVAMDAYGDLLVAEAVHHVTEGRAEVAGAALDAAAGLTRPPRLGLLRTPRQGRAVGTGVVVVLPHVADAALPADPTDRATLAPAALADPATAAFLAAQVGADWTFEVAAGGLVATVTLDALGLGPADALALARTDLERLAVAAGAAALGAEPAAATLTGGDGVARYEAAARLVALIGRRPADPDATAERPDSAAPPAAAHADLLARYARVRDTAAALAARLAAELALTADDGGIGGADPAVLARLVTAARAWGLAPDPVPTEAASGAEAAQRRLVAQAVRVRELLDARLDAAADTAPAGPGSPSPAAELTRDDLVGQLAALVSPTGQLAVTARLPRSALPALTGDGTLDADWLPVVAAVREPLARLEAHQLADGTPAAAGPALTGWSNKPGDPWQSGGPDGRRLVVAYADPTLDLTATPPGAPVAVAVLDRFTEVVPEAAQATAATFGFDAPAARAPQAILLAVPPDLSRPLDPETLVELLADVRELARARVARPADLTPGLRGLLPAGLLPADGPTGVPLDATRR